MRFEFATATCIIFGEGTAATLPDLGCTFGVRPLVVTGGSRERAATLVSVLSAETFAVSGEPTVDLIRKDGWMTVLHLKYLVLQGGPWGGIEEVLPSGE